MMTNAEKIEALKANLDQLDAKGRSFADSLLNYWTAKGFLSEKQWYWVGKLGGCKREEPKKKSKAKAKAPKAKPDERFEAMLTAFRSANAGQQRRIKRALHPDLWDGAPWATELFKAAN
jgi:hypothetical protein